MPVIANWDNQRVLARHAYVEFEPPQRESWQDRALCIQVDPELFFMEGAGGQPYQYARKICTSCDVRLICLRYILELEGDAARQDRHGFWGGKTPSERIAIWAKIQEAKAASQELHTL